MPELPDVETFKRYLDATALHHRIEHVTVRDRQVLDRLSPGRLRKTAAGKSLETTRRHGKHLFARLSGGPWLELHFGMTGYLEYEKQGGDPPQYAQVLFRFANGYRLAYVNKRKLGHVSLVDDPDAFIEGEELGPDADRLDLNRFRKLLEGRRGGIKSALMDQSLVAGLGNVYTDEILNQAGIHPATAVAALDDGEVGKLHRVLRRVLAVTVRHHAQPDAFPSSYLTGRREEGADCPRCGGKIAKATVNGRSTYFCPRCQRKRS